MANENRFTQDDLQSVAPSDAYEAYWSSTEEEASGPATVSPFSSSGSSPFCKPGDAYNELWQHWDAQW